MLDHPLLLDIFSLGTPQLRTGLGFLFFFKVSFEKHPTDHDDVDEDADDEDLPLMTLGGM